MYSYSSVVLDLSAFVRSLFNYLNVHRPRVAAIPLKGNAGSLRHVLIQRVFEPLKICGALFKLFSEILSVL